MKQRLSSRRKICASVRVFTRRADCVILRATVGERVRERINDAKGTIDVINQKKVHQMIRCLSPSDHSHTTSRQSSLSLSPFCTCSALLSLTFRECTDCVTVTNGGSLEPQVHWTERRMRCFTCFSDDARVGEDIARISTIDDDT